MTTSSPSTPTFPSKNEGAKRPLWWAFAQHCIARMREIESDLAHLERRAKDGNDHAMDSLLDYQGSEAATPPPHTRPAASAVSVADLMTEAKPAPRFSQEEWNAIRAAGGDPFATDADGNSLPDVVLHVPDLILLTRLAATFLNEGGLQESLHPGAVTIIIGLEPSLGLGKLLSETTLPNSWTTFNRAPRTAALPVLQVPERAPSGNELERCLYRHAPILLPVEKREDIPPLLTSTECGTRVLTLAEMDPDILIATLVATHSATGRIDEDAVRSALPSDAALAAVEPEQLAVAFRARTAGGVADRIRAMLSISTAKGPHALKPDIAGIEGSTPAHSAARNAVEDLNLWQDGEIAWTDMSRSLLVHGAPGTGKTYLARQMATAAGVDLVEGSFAAWQAAGHLGQMLSAMRKCFDDAISRAPSILFIDEIDAVGSRFDGDQHGMNYRTQVVNGFLQQIDRLTVTPGVILIGACNQLDRLDPAITRPGRFDEIVRMPLPTRKDIARILEKRISDALDPSDILQLAKEAVGKTPAKIDAAIRAAKSDARRGRMTLTADLVRSHLGLGQPDPALLHRIAVHEAGHVVGAMLLAPGAVTQVSISEGGGLTERMVVLNQLTVEEIEVELVIHMAGRAAERLLIGSISGGAGGDARSDIAQATALVLKMDRELGLGRNGEAWLGPAEMHRLSLEEKQRVSAKLAQATDRAERLLESHNRKLTDLAAALVEARELEGAELQRLLADLPRPAAGEASEAASSLRDHRA